MMSEPLSGPTGAPDTRSAYDGSAIVALCVGIAAVVVSVWPVAISSLVMLARS